jgi:soluble lytic murein transglycosylase-like protein
MARVRLTPFLIYLVFAWGAGTDSAAAQSQEVLRVTRQGVIYYYFPSRPEAAAGKLRRLPMPPRRVAAAPARKIPPQQLAPHIEQAAREHRLPPALIQAIIRVESGYNPAATSPKGAQGLMQLMPETAREVAVADPYDVQQNIWGGTRYLSKLLARFNYRLPLALAAYNAGPGRVERRQDIPDIPETQQFVRQVCAEFLKYRAQEKRPASSRP